MPIHDPEKLHIAQQRRLFIKICRRCGARNPRSAEKCRRCKSKNLRWKRRERTR
ncbi:MAG: 50S ribosomal protein L40e [archaeon GB-1867-035]|nr:50S ribosomal protein L40e [Candidatus Culexmicrobium profundum]